MGRPRTSIRAMMSPVITLRGRVLNVRFAEWHCVCVKRQRRGEGGYGSFIFKAHA